MQQNELKIALAATCLLSIINGLRIGVATYATVEGQPLPLSDYRTEIARHVPTIVDCACSQLSVRVGRIEEVRLFASARWTMIPADSDTSDTTIRSVWLTDWVMDVAERMAEHL